MLIENRGLRAEVQRLRLENSDLLRRVRFSDSNAHYMKNQVQQDMCTLYIHVYMCMYIMLYISPPVKSFVLFTSSFIVIYVGSV